MTFEFDKEKFHNAIHVRSNTSGTQSRKEFTFDRKIINADAIIKSIEDAN